MGGHVEMEWLVTMPESLVTLVRNTHKTALDPVRAVPHIHSHALRCRVHCFGNGADSTREKTVETTILGMTTTKADMQSCIDACSTCHEVCLQMAMTYCLDRGGQHVEPAHFRLMINCAQICETSVNLQLSGSPFSEQHCQCCADVCKACADSCRSLDGMEECVRACEACAASCRSIAVSRH